MRWAWFWWVGKGVENSWKKSEGLDVARTDDGEVPAVYGRDVTDAQPFCCGHHRGVDGAQRQVSVPCNKFSDPQPISRGYRLDDERTVGQVAEESHLRFGAQPGAEEVDHLGDDECRDDQRTRMSLQKLQRRRVVSIVGVDVGIERARIDNNCPYGPTSAARISSIRSEISLRPLRPAAAAFRRRWPPGAPRYASSASRLTSEMVKFRRAASCRRRASNASGILTVVRFMYASIRWLSIAYRPEMSQDIGDIDQNTKSTPAASNVNL